MSEVAFEIYSENNALQATGEGGFGYGLSTYGALLLTDDGATHPQPMVTARVTVSGTNPIFSFKSDKQINVERVVASGGNFTFYVRCQSSTPVGLQYWIFDAAGQTLKDASMGDIEFALYDATGVKTFDAAMASLVIVDAIETAPVSTEIPFGYDSNIANGTAVTVPAGKTYAIVQSTPIFIPTTYDRGSYSSNTSPPMDTFPDDNAPGPGMKWRHQNLEYFHSTGGYTAPNRILAGITQFEKWTQWYPASSTPFIQINGQCRHLIVDVTNFPSVAMPNPATVNVAVSTALREVSVVSATAATTTTPSVTATPSGGTAPYTYLWYRTGGVASIVKNGSDTLATFSTTNASQTPGTTAEATWVCRATDSKGGVGYSQPVTFRHIVGAADITPDTPAFSAVAINTNEPTGSASTSSQITGINQPIDLRVERYSYSGNLTTCVVNVFRRASTSDPWTYLGNFDVLGSGYRYFDVIGVNNGDYLRYEVDGRTSERKRTATFDIAVWNLTGVKTTISNKPVTVTVDADDNYIVADPNPNAVDWANISGSSNDASFWLANPEQTISGINQTITVRATISNVSKSANIIASSRLDFQRDGAYVHDTSGIGNGFWTEATLTNGQKMRFIAHVGTTQGTGTLSYTVTVTNQTTGAILDTFTVNQTVDADNNHNMPDYTPDAITWPNQTWSTNSEITNGAYSANGPTITGINQTITLRFQVTTLTSSASGQHLDITNAAGTSLGRITHYGLNGYVDVSVTNGAFLQPKFTVQTSKGRRVSAGTVTVYNMSQGGANIGSFNFNITVDADDNFNNADYDLNAIDWANCSFTTNDNIGAGSNAARTISGINQTVNLRFTLSNVSTNFNGGDFYVYRNGVKSRGANGFGNGYWTDVDVVNGDSVYFYYDGVTLSGRKTMSGTITVTNTTTGAVVDTFTISGVLDNDNNWNVPDYTPDAISVGSLTLNTNEPSGLTNARFFQITGINQPITLRFTRGNQWDSGGIFTRRLYIYHSTVGSGGPWTEYFVGAGAVATADITVSNGHWIYVQAFCDTTSGIGQTSFTGYITNQTTGAQLASFSVSATVDADNNYNVAAPLAVSLNNTYVYQSDWTNQGRNYQTYAAGQVTATVTGAIGTATYVWEKLSGLSGFSVSGSTHPAFAYYGRTNYNVEGSYRLKVTDSQGRVAYSDVVTVNLVAGNVFG